MESEWELFIMKWEEARNLYPNQFVKLRKEIQKLV